jgi:hypothetical protein
MALTQDHLTTWDFTIPSAYYKVTSVTIESKIAMTVFVRVFANKDCPSAVLETRYSGEYNLGGPNPIKQAYLHLKSLPEFADAVDC